MDTVIARLLASDEPSIRYSIRVDVLGEDPRSPALAALQQEIRTSPRVAALLSERTTEGIIPHRVYRKWNGAHWVFAALADLHYPAGDPALAPLVDQVCACWLSPRHVEAVAVVQGRPRRCASQEANALYAMLALGFTDARADMLAANLLRWQWPDGGWNCDKNPDAATSSFHESWLPLRALARYARLRQHEEARQAVTRIAELFLSRRLLFRQRDGSLITPRFLQLAYPPYWHYGLLNILKVMGEANLLHDPRCADALDVLAAKRLPDGGFPCEIQYHGTAPSRATGYSTVKWGRKSQDKMNEWVTTQGLTILRAANCL